MKLYCDTQFKAAGKTLKKHLVVVERGIPRIIYYKMYFEQKKPTYKQVSFNEEIIKGLIDMQKDRKISEVDFKDIVVNIKHTYEELKSTNEEGDTLQALTSIYNEMGEEVHLGNGVLLEDESFAFFYDFSDIIAGKTSAIFPKGLV
ncbi:MAG: hypothetical protein COA44_06080 [Arcobacter sp.]|nr:MAG: hypothetical protein COA44_06080 [Arcobacter sp.]